MTIRFRDASRADVAAIMALLVDDALGAQRETAPPEAYLAGFDALALDPNSHVVVGEDADGRIVATFQLTFISGLSHRAARRAQIESVRVAADLRSQGVGAALMAEAEARARRAGCRLMQLTTHADRKRAHAFYDRLGYLPTHIGYKKPL